MQSISPVSTRFTAIESHGQKDHRAQANQLTRSSEGQNELRQSFDSFVGEAFYGQLLSAMRKTVGEPAYFHGGRAEEVFRGQLDQMLSTEMTKASAAQFTGPMFELFSLTRS